MYFLISDGSELIVFHVSSEYSFLWQRTQLAFKYIWENYRMEYDFILKVSGKFICKLPGKCNFGPRLDGTPLPISLDYCTQCKAGI